MHIHSPKKVIPVAIVDSPIWRLSEFHCVPASAAEDLPIVTEVLDDPLSSQYVHSIYLEGPISLICIGHSSFLCALLFITLYDMSVLGI